MHGAYARPSIHNAIATRGKTLLSLSFVEENHMITTTNREYIESVFGLFEVQSFAHLGAQCLSHAME